MHDLQRPEFVIPDRGIYVNMKQPFLRDYLDLVVQTCHKRGAPATGGMTALTLPEGRPETWPAILDKMCEGKSAEIRAGVDGFLFYDLAALPRLKKLWEEHTDGPNQLHVLREEVSVGPADLIRLPEGGVSALGLANNIAVGVQFIQSWLMGDGVFQFRGQVEDSATAEISRSQVWQWVRHGVRLEGGTDGQYVTRKMVFGLVDSFLKEGKEHGDHKTRTEAANLFKQLVTMRDFPEFITTFLNNQSIFVSRHLL
jgi:malate synthase A